MLSRDRQFVLSIALTTLSLGGAAFGQAPLVLQAQRTSLNDAQNIALRQNPDVLQASLEVHKATAKLKSIVAQRFPKILAITYIGQQISTGFGQNLAVIPGVFQPVTQQYRLGLQVQEANLAVRVSQQQLRLAQQRTVAEVKRYYLSMLALQSLIASLEKNLNFLKELERYEKAEVQKGAVLAVDLLLVQARVARIEFEVARARDDLITMGETLNRLLGRQPRAEILLVDEPATSLPEINEEQEIAEALSNRPELNEIKLNIHRSNLEERVELSRYIPDISFGAAGIYSRYFYPTLPRTLTTIGFLATWEPWDWGRRIQLRNESHSQMQQDEIKFRDMTNSVSIAVDKAIRDVRLAEKEARAGALAETSTQEQLRIIDRRFTVGAALLKDVLEAQTAYTQAIADNVKAKTDVIAARVELYEALGKDF